jgi:hypothetical protein
MFLRFPGLSVFALLLTAIKISPKCRRQLSGVLKTTEVGEDDIASLGISDGLPRHYVNTADGLFYIGGQKPVLVCGTPVVPVALFCGKDKESSLGIRLMTGNGLGKYVKALVRFEDIVQSGAQVVANWQIVDFVLAPLHSSLPFLTVFFSAAGVYRCLSI